MLAIESTSDAAPREPPMKSTATLLIFSIVVTCIHASRATAQAPQDAARTHFDAGTLAFTDGRWLDCAHDFERSFQIVFAPELLYNIGLCYQRAGAALPDADARPLLERALAAYERYLRELPSAPDAASVRTTIGDVQSRLARVDEPAPAPVVMEDVRGDQMAAPDEVEVSTPVPQRDEPPPIAPEREPTRHRSFVVTIVGAVLTAISFATAIALGIHAGDLYATDRATCAMTAAGCSDEQISDVSTFASAATAMYVASGVLLAGTALGFALEWTSGSDAPSRAMLTVSGAF